MNFNSQMRFADSTLYYEQSLCQVRVFCEPFLGACRT